MRYNKNIKNELKYPSDIDEQCIELYYLLNSLPDTETYESCCGHGKEPYMMFFRCGSIDVLTRLGRAVNKNYSDGNWEIVVDSTDTSPYGCFWLRTNKVLSKEELDNSLDGLLYNIRYWFSDEFDEYFKEKDLSVGKEVKEEPVSEDLEEAANDYAHDLVHDDVFETFIAGAKWQKEQLIGKATEWLCHNYDKYIRIIGSSVYPAYVELCKDFQKAMEE